MEGMEDYDSGTRNPKLYTLINLHVFVSLVSSLLKEVNSSFYRDDLDKNLNVSFQC